MSIRSQWITALYGTFQDEQHLYMVLQYAANGELSDYLPLSEEQTRFYAGELILAVEYLHTVAFVIHRYSFFLPVDFSDIKPENLFLTSDWHLVLGDFGCSVLTDKESGSQRKLRSRKKTKTTAKEASFQGSADFIAPELINETKSCFASDLWALGCTIYRMATGQP